MIKCIKYRNRVKFTISRKSLLGRGKGQDEGSYINNDLLPQKYILENTICNFDDVITILCT